MHRALIRWEGPRHSSFITFSTRLLFFNFTWPSEGKTLHEALRAVGFLYVGNYLIVFVTDDGGASVPLLRFIYKDCLQVGDNTEDGGLTDWLVTDDPWKNTLRGFPTAYMSNK